MNIIAVGMGGFIGAVLRYLIGLIPVKETMVFPVKTFCINIIGCLLIGLITVLASRNPEINPKWILFLKAGICGGFTTFSTFSLDTYNLFHNKDYATGGIYAVLSVVCCVFGIFCGRKLAILVRG